MAPRTPPRIYLVGTDTSVGKTTLLCTLAVTARARGLALLPYKPAQSGDGGPNSDAARLAMAAGMGPAAATRLCPTSFAQPIAPGLAEDPSPFLRFSPSENTPTFVAPCAPHLHALELESTPNVTIIEGAGGLWVPMPGGTWQPQWISSLAAASVVVGRAGLGAINHMLLTLDALCSAKIPVLGFYLCEVDLPDASNALNPAIIERARAIPHLGTLPHLPPRPPDSSPTVAAAHTGLAPTSLVNAHNTQLLDALLSRLPSS